MEMTRHKKYLTPTITNRTKTAVCGKDTYNFLVIDSEKFLAVFPKILIRLKF